TFTPLVSAHVAHRWLAPDNLWLTGVAVIAHGIVLRQLWISVWGPNDQRPLQWAVALFVLAFLGIAMSLYPYIVPYRYTLFEAANDHATLAFAAGGIGIVLPVVFLYLILGYRVFRGKSSAPTAVSVDLPSVPSRRTSGHQADLHMS